MIKTLSPYYLNIPLKNPDTLVVCSSYTINIYIWKGNKSAIPATPEYQKTNINATGLDGTDKVNISRIVNDFIDFNFTQSTVTSLEDGNNQAWVLTKLFYDDEPLAAKFTTIQLAIKGYGYFKDGSNPILPSNKILLESDEIKVNRNGYFVLPILLDEISSTILASNDTISIYYEDTLLDVMANDSLGFIPTTITAVNTAMTGTVGTLSIESNKVKFTAGTAYTSPQTFTYTITDVFGNSSTATVTLNISDVPTTLLAVDDSYSTNNEDVIVLDVMSNDYLGTAPTTIISVDDSLLTIGDITITGAGTQLTFTPNGVLNAGETFTYTLQDSNPTTDTATVTITTTALGGRYLDFVEVFSYGGNANPTALIYGTYADTLEDFMEDVTFGTPLVIERCVIESSLVSSIPLHTVFTFNDLITC
jgi:hypothetical protein